MAFGKCDKCEQSVKVKQSGKRYILPMFSLFSGLLMLAYESGPGDTRSVITILGGLSATAGFVWLVVKGVRYISN